MLDFRCAHGGLHAVAMATAHGARRDVMCVVGL